jgi:hypothetical protein
MSEMVSAELFHNHESRIAAAIDALTTEVHTGFQRLIESRSSRQPLDPASLELLKELLDRTRKTTASLEALAKSNKLP